MFRGEHLAVVQQQQLPCLVHVTADGLDFVQLANHQRLVGACFNQTRQLGFVAVKLVAALPQLGQHVLEDSLAAVHLVGRHPQVLLILLRSPPRKSLRGLIRGPLWGLSCRLPGPP